MTAQVAGHLVSSVGEYHKWIDVCSAPPASGWADISKVKDRHALLTVRRFGKRLQDQAQRQPSVIELLVASRYAIQSETCVLGRRTSLIQGHERSGCRRRYMLFHRGIYVCLVVFGRQVATKRYTGDLIRIHSALRTSGSHRSFLLAPLCWIHADWSAARYG